MDTGLMTVKFTDDGFGIITMRNGENRLNAEFVELFQKALDIVERNAACKALISTGEGKFYSNGLDLKWMSKETDNTKYRFIRSLNELQWRICHFPLPTIAALNGHTYAGGAFLAICHDYRVMNSRRGWICWNETKRMIKFGETSLEILRTKLKRMDAVREAVLFSKAITAQRARELELVDAVADPSELIESAKRLALEALGRDGIDREMLQIMKKDLYPHIVPYPKVYVNNFKGKL